MEQEQIDQLAHTYRSQKAEYGMGVLEVCIDSSCSQCYVNYIPYDICDGCMKATIEKAITEGGEDTCIIVTRTTEQELYQGEVICIKMK